MSLRASNSDPVSPHKPVARVLAWVSRLSFRARLLSTVWLLFAALVATHIHGSSIALSAKLWAPQEAENHYLAQPILNALHGRAPWLRDFLMAKSQAIRSDEWAISSLWSQAQFTHVPRFPMRNTNIGDGQNMLLISWVPVLHPASLARPVTWGYLLFGSQAGPSWLWGVLPFY